jgi:hypothetical protein
MGTSCRTLIIFILLISKMVDRWIKKPRLYFEITNHWSRIRPIPLWHSHSFQQTKIRFNHSISRQKSDVIDRWRIFLFGFYCSEHIWLAKFESICFGWVLKMLHFCSKTEFHTTGCTKYTHYYWPHLNF